MIEGIIAGSIFVILIWLSIKIVAKMQGDDRKALAFFACLLVNVGYLLAAIGTVETCGNLGYLLIAWAKFSLGGAIVFVGLGLLIFGLIAGIFFITTSVERNFPKATQNMSKALDNSVKSKKTYFIAAIGFIALFGWLGSLPNPNCEEKIAIDSSIVEIREVLEENSPELVEDFNRIINDT